MSSLFVYHVSHPDQPLKVLNHPQDITASLAQHGVGFERWPVPGPIAAGAGSQEVLAACQSSLDTLCGERALAACEVIRFDSRQPSAEPGERLEEHCFEADELRWFVAGRGQLSLHLGDHVYALWCERNDLVTLPAGTRQWFDAGENPYLVAIRLFRARSVAPQYCADGIAGRFPRFEY